MPNICITLYTVAFSTISYSTRFPGHDFVSLFAYGYMVQHSYSSSTYLVDRTLKFYLFKKRGFMTFRRRR